MIHRAGWCSGNTQDLYSGDHRLESRWGTGYTDSVFRGIPQSSQANAALLSQLGHDCSFPNHLQFIILYAVT
jgi:hypothetical protein